MPTAPESGAQVRAAAALTVAEVLRGHALPEALAPRLQALSDPRDRALLQNLGYGTLRWLPRLQAASKPLLQRPLKDKDRDIAALLAVGLYQLLYTRVPEHAAIATTVEAARVLKKPWAVKMSNGVLRNFQRNRESLLARADAEPEGRFAHPAWILEKLRAAWPQDWERVAAANNTQPPMTLRVNLRQGGRDAYLKRLADVGVEAAPAAHSTAGIVLGEPRDVYSLPGFAEGAVSVQDEAAQFAAFLLDAPAGARVLDACAAPGGKSAHLLECYPDLDLTCLDSSDARLQQVRENFTRLRLSAALACADAADLAAWWDGRPFSRILLDAPCSASGVVRRHPDIKYLRRPGDISALAARQAALLDALWQTLAAEGWLLYVTCSVWPEENSRQIEAFTQRHEDAEILPLAVAWGRDTQTGRQVLPGENGMDGFYYACLRKIPREKCAEFY